MSLSSIVVAWREAARRRAEIDAVSERELDGWGLSRDEFRDLARMSPAREARMEAMAAIHGVSPAALDRDPLGRRQAALACARCRDEPLCTRMIADWAEPQEMGFCPNHATFTAMAAAPAR